MARTTTRGPAASALRPATGRPTGFRTADGPATAHPATVRAAGCHRPAAGRSGGNGITARRTAAHLLAGPAAGWATPAPAAASLPTGGARGRRPAAAGFAVPAPAAHEGHRTTGEDA